MKILAIETSCDETAAAVTEGTAVLSSVKITQEIHSQWGGVVPSLAKRDHEKNIDWVIDQAMTQARVRMEDIGAIAVTQGPGLAIALGVGIAKAKELAARHTKPLIAVNHVEGHILSSLIGSKEDITFPCTALVVSGGHTQVILVKEIGKYEILAESLDDDIGEALDKGARMLGLPYPGGPALEQLAAKGDVKKYKLPLPMAGREDNRFSYAGLKSAFFRLVHSMEIDEIKKADLAAVYQWRIFQHLIRITQLVLKTEDLLVGGGVAANATLRKELNDLGVRVHYPENMVLCTDNAAMIGVTAGFKADRGEFSEPEKVDRKPRWRVDEL